MMTVFNNKKILLFSLALTFFSTSALAANKTDSAIFAGGCFWCIEQAFEDLEGVLSAESGYIDGHQKNPNYKQVSAGTTGHTEAVKIIYDPAKVSFKTLLKHFWKNIDPTVKNRQFCDVGSQYRSGIYYQNENQKKEAENSLKKIKTIFNPVYTDLKKSSAWYTAEEYHQDYYKKNSFSYKYYKYSCGREARLQELWTKQRLKTLEEL